MSKLFTEPSRRYGYTPQVLIDMWLESKSFEARQEVVDVLRKIEPRGKSVYYTACVMLGLKDRSPAHAIWFLEFLEKSKKLK